jgi:hypothetical protein
VITIAIKRYDPIIAILRSHLLANTELASFIGEWSIDGVTGPAIYPEYIDSVVNPVFPAITICQEYNQTLKNRTGYEQNRYYIHGWVKPGQNPAPDDAAYLHNLVVSILDVDPVKGKQVPEFALCRKVDGRCPLYDKETRTTFFMTEWLIYASKSLINS